MSAFKVRWATALALALGLAFGPAALAQAPDTAAAGEPDTIKRILEQELEPAPGGYTYNPQGRRDPFVSLIRPVGADTATRVRKPGMEGFMVQEVALKGIVRTTGSGMGAAEKPGFIAMVLGTDGKSYFINVGQRLFDGEVVAIDATSVTMRQEITDPLSPVKSREVRKSLYPTEEARQ